MTVIEKTMTTGFLNAKRMPMKCHENVLVFYKKLPTYNPQMIKGQPHWCDLPAKTSSMNYGKYNYGKYNHAVEKHFSDSYYPRDVLKVKTGWHAGESKSLHPTQKPVSACEYFIKTYTNEGELILDNCMGSGTTAVACINTNRHFIGFELEKEYFEIACKRIANAKAEKESKFAFC